MSKAVDPQLVIRIGRADFAPLKVLVANVDRLDSLTKAHELLVGVGEVSGTFKVIGEKPGDRQSKDDGDDALDWKISDIARTKTR